jgi:hypothetical protein
VKRLSQAGTPAILVRSETTIERPEKALAAICAWRGVAVQCDYDHLERSALDV